MSSSYSYSLESSPIPSDSEEAMNKKRLQKGWFSFSYWRLSSPSHYNNKRHSCSSWSTWRWKYPHKRIFCFTLKRLCLLLFLLLLFVLTPLSRRLLNSSGLPTDYEDSVSRMDSLLGSTRAQILRNVDFFKPYLYFPPPLSKRLHSPVFGELKTAAFMASALRGKVQVMALRGFRVCPQLDGSLFHLRVPLEGLGGSIVQVNPSRKRLLDLLDKRANEIYAFLMDKQESVFPEDAKRLACYAVAQGNNPLARLSDSAFVYRLHAPTYFQSSLPALSPSPHLPRTQEQQLKRVYKMAYLILVQEIGALDQLKELLKVLDDGLGIILLQVDSKDPSLLSQVQTLLQSLHSSSPTTQTQPRLSQSKNIFISHTSYPLILGHSSFLFAQLNGFFELLDKAKWDYLINLSAYDWPLRKNRELHHILQTRGPFSWIDFWSDSQAMAARLFRPHLGSNLSYTPIHDMDWGVREWPFPNWRTFRQSPWMILTREAVAHFRRDPRALNYLAFLEHTLSPDESFFATVLLNAPQFELKVHREKRRYNREPGSGGSSWIGWADRHIFPPGEKEPRYLFFRPFNPKGTLYEESKLVRWVERNHLDYASSSSSSCVVSQIGHKEECLRAFVEKIAIDNHVILIPVNKAYFYLAANLRCSLKRKGWTNILHWALDSETHDELLEAGLLSLYSPLPGSAQKEPSLVSGRDGPYAVKDMLRQKPRILLTLMRAGLHIWAMDADSVVLDDFMERTLKFTSEPLKADILLALREPQRLETAANVGKRVPKLDMGLLYLRNTLGARQFLHHIQKRLDENLGLVDQEAMEKVVGDESLVTITGLGLSRDDLYPSMHMGGLGRPEDRVVSGPLSPKGTRLQPDRGDGKGDRSGLSQDVWRPHERVSESTSDSSLSGFSLGRLFSTHRGSSSTGEGSSYSPTHFDDSTMEVVGQTDSALTRVHLLDQLEFVTGALLKDPSAGRLSPKVLHVGKGLDQEKVLRSKGFWFIDTQGRCIEAPSNKAEGKKGPLSSEESKEAVK